MWLNMPWLKEYPKIPWLENIQVIFKTTRVAKNIWIINTIALIWRKNMLGYLSASIFCSEKCTAFCFCELRSRRFSAQMEAIVNLIYSNFPKSFSKFCSEWKFSQNRTSLQESAISLRVGSLWRWSAGENSSTIKRVRRSLEREIERWSHETRKCTSSPDSSSSLACVTLRWARSQARV